MDYYGGPNDRPGAGQSQRDWGTRDTNEGRSNLYTRPEHQVYNNSKPQSLNSTAKYRQKQKQNGMAEMSEQTWSPEGPRSKQAPRMQQPIPHDSEFSSGAYPRPSQGRSDRNRNGVRDNNDSSTSSQMNGTRRRVPDGSTAPRRENAQKPDRQPIGQVSQSVNGSVRSMDDAAGGYYRQGLNYRPRNNSSSPYNSKEHSETLQNRLGDPYARPGLLSPNHLPNSSGHAPRVADRGITASASFDAENHGIGGPPRPATATGVRGGNPPTAVKNRSTDNQRSGRRLSDALPSHPTPVRPGLGPGPQASQQRAQTAPSQQPHKMASQPVTPIELQPGHAQADPVTHQELQQLRRDIQERPANQQLRVRLAKRLVEAARTLADDEGRADTRTRNRNRERFVGESHQLLKKLAVEGNAEAQFYLADCLGSGVLGIPNDAKEAFQLYQQAAKAGHAQSAYRTAVCCEIGPEEGGGTRKDTLKAFQWYKRAAALGDQPSMYKVGMIQLKGLLGQEVNVSEAVTWLKRAVEYADEQNPHAMHELGTLYDSQASGRLVEPDDAKALELFKSAANHGFKRSQFRLGQAFEYGMLGCLIDARNSIIWYTRAAAQGEHQSELALSGWYLTGSEGILEPSDTEAYLWARKAALAEPPLAKAMFALGYYTEVGIGCPRSLEEAKKWYSRAAAHQFPKAQQRLEELRKGGPKVQKNRENLSRKNQKQQEADCVVM